MSELGLKQFRPFDHFPQHFMCLMMGMRRCGKTVMMSRMLFEMRLRLQHHHVYLISGSASTNPGQYAFLPPKTTHTNVSNVDGICQEIIADQQRRIHKYFKELQKSEGAKVGARGRGASGPRTTQAAHRKRDFNDTGDGTRGKKGRKKKARKGSDIPQARELDPTSHLIRKAGDPKRQAGPGEGDDGDDGAAPVTQPSQDAGGPVSTAGTDTLQGVRDMIQQQARLLDKLHEDPTAPQILIIMDDVVNENSIRHSPHLNFLAVSGRHINASVFILSQMMSGSGNVPPAVRTQCDAIIVVCQPRSIGERKKIAEEYLTTENKKDSLTGGLQTLNAITAVKHRAMVVLTTDPHIRVQRGFLYWYGPVPHPLTVPPNFSIGTDKQWEVEESDVNFKLGQADSGGGGGGKEGRFGSMPKNIQWSVPNPDKLELWDLPRMDLFGGPRAGDS